jgi:hypothetical protein
MSAISIYINRDKPLRRQDLEISEFISKNIDNNSTLIFTGLTRASIQYYLSQKGLQPELLSFPMEVADHMGSLDQKAILLKKDAINNDIETILHKVRTQLKSGHTALLIGTQDKINYILYNALASDFYILPLGKRFQQSVLGTDVTVYAIKNPAYTPFHSKEVDNYGQ